MLPQIFISKKSTPCQLSNIKSLCETLTRDIDLFATYKTPCELVKNYHLDAVRMYYDSYTVRMYNSCFAALSTGINATYKWFSCNKIPCEIVLKYAQRGYSTLLNNGEAMSLKKICFRI